MLIMNDIVAPQSFVAATAALASCFMAANSLAPFRLRFNLCPPCEAAEAAVEDASSLGITLHPRVILSKPQVNRLGLVSSDQAVQQTILEWPWRELLGSLAILFPFRS